MPERLDRLDARVRARVRLRAHKGVWRHGDDRYGQAEVGPVDGQPQIRLTTDMNLGLEGPRAMARRRLRAGEQVFCALSWGNGTPPESFAEAHQRLSQTADF